MSHSNDYNQIYISHLQNPSLSNYESQNNLQPNCPNSISCTEFPWINCTQYQNTLDFGNGFYKQPEDMNISPYVVHNNTYCAYEHPGQPVYCAQPSLTGKPDYNKNESFCNMPNNEFPNQLNLKGIGRADMSPNNNATIYSTRNFDSNGNHATNIYSIDTPVSPPIQVNYNNPSRSSGTNIAPTKNNPKNNPRNNDVTSFVVEINNPAAGLSSLIKNQYISYNDGIFQIDYEDCYQSGELDKRKFHPFLQSLKNAFKFTDNDISNIIKSRKNIYARKCKQKNGHRWASTKKTYPKKKSTHVKVE